MDRLLRYGDVFKSKSLNSCRYLGDEPRNITVCPQWYGGKQAPDYSNTEFVVTKITMDGGGHGHGCGDSYPDGHHVYAETLNGLVKLDFYQTDSFITRIDPADIELLREGLVD